MRYSDFEAMVRRMAGELPPEYLDGIADVTVSRQTLPHPLRGEIYTLGECIPLPAAEHDARTLQSRVVLYHGSFQALAALDEAFDWRDEAWETLTHEVQHHLEWKANAPRLEALDRAAEANFARQDGEPFDPLFYLDGERIADGVYRVEGDYFLDRVVKQLPARARLTWHGRDYAVALPPAAALPALLSILGVEDPPPGELVLVLRRRPGWRDLFRRAPPTQVELDAVPAG